MYDHVHDHMTQSSWLAIDAKMATKHSLTDAASTSTAKHQKSGVDPKWKEDVCPSTVSLVESG